MKYGQNVNMNFKNYNNQKLISIVVPCFNSGETLDRTIQSIKNQTWIEKEIILVNDGSNDKNTLEVLEGYKNDSLIKVINQKNKGLSSARNTGVIHSRGNYIFFLDSDDWINLNALEEFYKFLQNNKNSSYVFSDCILEGSNKGIRKKVFNLFEQMFINQIPYSIFIPKNIFVDNGFYDENMLLGYEDWELNIRLAANKCYGKRLSKPLFHYNVSNSGMLISKSIKNHINIWNYIKGKNSEFYKFKNVINVFYQWSFKQTNYPSIFIFLWFLILEYLPKNLTLMIFLNLRKIKFFLKK